MEPDRRRRLVGWALLAIAFLAGGALFLFVAPIPQDPGYHDFADDRPLLGIPNFADVVSNLPFAFAGIAGLLVLSRRGGAPFRDPRERLPWLLFFSAVTATSVGSAIYHLDPGNGTLFVDRLPLALSLSSFLAALIGERLGVSLGRRLLGPLSGVAVGSVILWYLTERAGAGDLRLYGLVQGYAMLAILLLLFAPSPYGQTRWYVAVLSLYGAAKGFELLDSGIYETGGISGHTLKHLASAAAAGLPAWMLIRRDPEKRG